MCSTKASIPAHAHERCARAATVLKLGNSGILILFGLPPTPTCVEFPPLVGGDLNLELLEGRRVSVPPQHDRITVLVPGCPHTGTGNLCDFDLWISASSSEGMYVGSPQHPQEPALEDADSDGTSTTAMTRRMIDLEEEFLRGRGPVERSHSWGMVEAPSDDDTGDQEEFDGNNGCGEEEFLLYGPRS